MRSSIAVFCAMLAPAFGLLASCSSDSPTGVSTIRIDGLWDGPTVLDLPGSPVFETYTLRALPEGSVSGDLVIRQGGELVARAVILTGRYSHPSLEFRLDSLTGLGPVGPTFVGTVLHADTIMGELRAADGEPTPKTLVRR